jgi:hypothetical protein
MKTKRISQSPFSNLRFVIGLLITLTGVFLGLLGFSPFVPAASITPAQQSHTYTNLIDPLVPAGFDCSKIHELGIDKQENLRAGAIMIFCGLSNGGKPSRSIRVSKFVQKLIAPVSYGDLDVDLITGPETYPNVTQSTTFSTANPDNPNQIVVAYNDSGRNAGEASVSTDGGTTFTRLNYNGQSPFPNTGSPVVLYSRHSTTWYTVWLDGDCGGLGGYKSTTPWDPSPDSWTHYCVHSNSQDDRESGWVDNNSSSPHYGNIYVSWNDFNVGGGALFVTVSTDDGNTWTPHQVTSGSPFIRNVQITGDLVTGDVYIAGMDEGGGGFPHNDANYFFRSTDGGNTWANTYIGPPFPGPGVTAVGYFACMFPDNGGYWRHEGWGEPAALNGIVHYVYDQHGTGSDPADVYYIRSTDMGQTFSAPLKLNTDTTSRPNWQPNLSVSPGGTLFAVWYDARESDSCTYGDPTVPCYRMWARKSNDSGLTWLPDDAFSDVVSPLPAQPDPRIVPTYAGDYDYGSAIAGKHLTSWTDGHVAINGVSQQDTFFDSEPAVAGTPTPTPTSCSVSTEGCGSIVTTPPTDFSLNVSDPVDPATLDASDFTVNATPADNVFLSNGDMTINFIFNTSPAVQGINTMHIAAGAFNCFKGPVTEFTCTFRYEAQRSSPTPRPRPSPIPRP